MRTFERGAERLTLHVRESGRGVTLVATGDGEPRSYSFRDAAAMMKFEAEMEEFLLYAGWALVRLSTTPAASAARPVENFQAPQQDGHSDGRSAHAVKTH